MWNSGNENCVALCRPEEVTTPIGFDSIIIKPENCLLMFVSEGWNQTLDLLIVCHTCAEVLFPIEKSPDVVLHVSLNRFRHCELKVERRCVTGEGEKVVVDSWFTWLGRSIAITPNLLVLKPPPRAHEVEVEGDGGHG